METKISPKRVFQLTEAECERLAIINAGLKRGDKKRIAEITEVHRVWVTYVLMGKGISERVLRAAEALIAERKINLTSQDYGKQRD
ncbi:MAG: hypothetical protein LBH06_07370 [Rikenellaceae bacterium]|jgi:hypothetical protein|nr:hypothetical protein [Rikenellaceae bacterium]